MEDLATLDAHSEREDALLTAQAHLKCRVGQVATRLLQQRVEVRAIRALVRLAALALLLLLERLVEDLEQLVRAVSAAIGEYLTRLGVRDVGHLLVLPPVLCRQHH